MATVKRLKAPNWCKEIIRTVNSVEMVKSWAQLGFFPIVECRKYGGNFAFLVFSVCAWLWEMGNFKRVMHIFLASRRGGESERVRNQKRE